MKQKPSTLLIAEANNYLDNLSKPKNVEEVESKINKLSKLKEEMTQSGFSASFPSMLLSIGKEIGVSTLEAVPDLKKQLRSFREFANMKKYVFNRVRISLSSHKLLLNMMRRGKVYEVADYLPYDGNYLATLVYLGEPALRAYHHITKILEKKKEETDGLNFVATIMHAGKKIDIPLQSDKNIEEKVKKNYGDLADVLDIRKQPPAPSLVSGQTTRTAIAVAYATFAAKEVYKMAEEEGNHKKTKEHEEYARILESNGLHGNIQLDMVEGYENLKDALYSKGLMRSEDGSLKLIPEVRESIEKRRAYYSSNVVKKAKERFAHDVFHFFVTEPKRVRSSLPIFPGVSTEVNEEQFDFLDVVGIKNTVDLINEKFKLESIGPTVPGKLLGAAFIFLSGKSADWCSKEFEIDKIELNKAVEKITPYLEKKSDQARRFVEGLGEV